MTLPTTLLAMHEAVRNAAATVQVLAAAIKADGEARPPTAPEMRHASGAGGRLCVRRSCRHVRRTPAPMTYV
jgi:hypothetical protein